MGTAPAATVTAADLEWASKVALSVYRRLAPLWDLDDLRQVAQIAVWRAREHYDPARNDNFQLYALPYVRGAVLMLVRSTWRDAQSTPWVAMTEGELDDDDQQAAHWSAGPGSDMEQQVDAARDASRLHCAIESLPVSQRRLVRLLLRGVAVSDAGRLLGFGKATAYQLRDEAFANIRWQMGGHR